jgi:hypothetical protein
MSKEKDKALSIAKDVGMTAVGYGGSAILTTKIAEMDKEGKWKQYAPALPLVGGTFLALKQPKFASIGIGMALQGAMALVENFLPQSAKDTLKSIGFPSATKSLGNVLATVYETVGYESGIAALPESTDLNYTSLTNTPEQFALTRLSF